VTLRDGLLAGRRLVVAGRPGAVIGGRLRALGASVQAPGEHVMSDEDAAAAWIAEHAPLHGLVLDAAPAFGAGGPAGLEASLRLAWLATRAVATGALIGAQQPGKVVLLAPRMGTGPHVEAARAGLVNLARTLSVEWARFAVTTVAILPGVDTTDEQVAELACFLVSPAGEYFSGCAFDLGAVPLPGLTLVTRAVPLPA
jgi:NAD(P)-dependent dehydrogenase (short-subunit alcohol dehydrogenase family)